MFAIINKNLLILIILLENLQTYGKINMKKKSVNIVLKLLLLCAAPFRN